DLGRKGQTVISELDETRDQMKIMQENFASAESEWKVQLEKYKEHIAGLENEILEKDQKLKNSELVAKNLESARYELSVKNAELQKKVVIVQENAAKQCEMYNKEIEGEVEDLKKNLEKEKCHVAELQKALDDFSSQSENKVLKARVKERTKLKALERELNALKKANEEKPKEILELHQHIAELEEDKGSLQLKVMELEDQVTQLDKLKEEHVMFETNIKEAQQKVDSLEKEITCHQTERDNWMQKYETLHESFNNLKESYAALSEKNAEAQKHMDSIIISNGEMENDYNKLRQEHSELVRKYQEAVENLQLLTDQKVAFELKNIELEEMRENDEKIRSELLCRIQELQQSLKNGSKPDIQLESENEALTIKLKDVTEKFVQSENKVTELQEHIESLQKTLEELENKHSCEISHMSEKIKDMETNCITLKENVQSMISQIAEKEREIEEIKMKNVSVQDELQGLLIHFQAKNVKECKDFAAEKENKYVLLQYNYEKVTEENNKLVNEIKVITQELDCERRRLADTYEEQHQVIEDRIAKEKALSDTIEVQSKKLVEYEEIEQNYICELESLRNKLVAECANSQTKVSSLFDQIKDLENELFSLRDQMDIASKTNKTLQEKFDKNKLEIKNLNEILTKNNLLLQEKDILVENLKFNISTAEESLADMQNENEKLNEILKENYSEIMSLKQNIQTLNSIITAKDEKISELMHGLQEAEKSIVAKNEQIKEVLVKDQQVKELKEQNAIFEQEKMEYKQLLSMKENMYLEEKSHFEAKLKEVIEEKKFLEQEKMEYKQSLSVKENTHLEEKSHFETKLKEVAEQKKLLERMLNEKAEECESLNHKIDQMEDLLKQKEIQIKSMLENLSSTNEVEEKSTLHFESQLEAKTRENKTLVEENNSLQKKISELKIAINEQSQELNDAISALETSQVQSQNLSNKILQLENDVKLSEDTKNEMNIHICDLEAQVFNLNELSNTLKNSIVSLQQEHSLQVSNLSEEVTKYKNEINTISDKLSVCEKEKKELIEQCNLLQISLTDVEIDKKSKQVETESLYEKINALEANMSEKSKIYDDEIKSLQDKIKYSDEALSSKSSEAESSLQKCLVEINLLRDSVEKLEQQLNLSDEEKQEIKIENACLQAVVNEHEKHIANLNEKLNAEQEKNSENLLMYENYKQSVETKLCNLLSLKQDYCKALKNIISLYGIEEDTSYVDSENYSIKPVQEFSLESKSVISRIITKVENKFKSLQEEISKYQNNYQSLMSLYESREQDFDRLQIANHELEMESEFLKQYIMNSSQVISTNIKQNDEKFDLIIKSLETKLENVQNLKSKLLILDKVVNNQHQQILSLEATKNSLSNLINDYDVEKENLMKVQLSEIQCYKEQIVQLETSLKEATENYCSLMRDIEKKHNMFENCQKEVLRLSNLLSAKDEAITKMMQEKQNSDNTVMALQTEISRAQSSVVLLQNEISDLRRQQKEYSEQSQVLESSHNVSNRLQVEVETLKNELAFCEEQKNSLQQHLDNCSSQLQQSLTEKSSLESNMEQMQHKLNDLIETNENLSNSLEECHLVLNSTQKNCQELEQRYVECNQKYEAKCKENENLQSSLEKATESVLWKENFEQLKCTLKNIKNVLSKGESISDSDFVQESLRRLRDEEIIELLSAFYSEILNTKKSQLEEIKNLKNFIEIGELKNKELSEELETLKGISQKCERDVNPIIQPSEPTKDACIIDVPTVSSNLTEKLLQQSHSVSFAEKQNEELKQEINTYKVKCAKMLTRLKLFKEKNDKLTGEWKELKDKYDELIVYNDERMMKEKEYFDEIIALKNENENLNMNLQFVEKQKKLELADANDIINQLKKRCALLDEECCKIRQELQEYKTACEEYGVSYELQREDNERLKVKLNEIMEQAEDAKSKLNELNFELNNLKNENKRLCQEAQNLREHSDMLLSDNDMYQNLIEKLTAAKHSLEQKLQETKEKYDMDLINLEKNFNSELAKYNTEKRMSTENETYISDLEKECLSLKEMCSELNLKKETLQKDCDIYHRNNNLLEKEKLYLQQQLLEKNAELEKIKLKLGDAVNNLSIESLHLERHGVSVVPSETNVDYLSQENADLKSKLNSLSEELNAIQKNFEILQQEKCDKDNEVLQLQNKLHNVVQMSDIVSADQKDARNLKIELQQAMSSLHHQGLRCEELSHEVSKLLEERDTLRWKLNQYQQLSSENKTKMDNSTNDSVMPASSELVSIKIESAQGTSVAALRDRLIETEKLCQELRRSNEALALALNIERDQKKMMEEQLGYAKEFFNDEKPSDEYQILLGDVNEPEMFVETNFSISRSMRTHSYKFRRWLKGRKNYVCRMVKSRNYPQLVYIFYLCFIHIFLLTCVLR
ncbi:protein MLP1-like, partial [Stegodyphus dumicola]|uniref:protein MLP1-like n=1 Tax=Stegodyphus dumicola TaxID=202533 RepID=UPI0015B205A0